MSKIRINELARQLEVKSREVIDKLHELGIAEKVTHSSSIDEEKADQLRRYYKGESYAPLTATHPNGAGAATEEHHAEAPPTAIEIEPERPARAPRPEPEEAAGQAEARTDATRESAT